MNEQWVTPKSGLRLRALFKDCNGTAIVRSDVSSASYTVYLKNMWSGTTTPVEHHNNVTIPLTSFMTTAPATDAETGLTYNFDYRISAITYPPFPTNGAHYIVQITTKDLNGEPHDEFIPCYSTMG